MQEMFGMLVAWYQYSRNVITFEIDPAPASSVAGKSRLIIQKAFYTACSDNLYACKIGTVGYWAP